MTQSRLRAAILVVSDTASRDPSTDKAGSVLAETFASEGDKWEPPVVKIVPDEKVHIQRQICQWADAEDEFMNVIVTTGGTGFAVRDETPEVCKSNETHSPMFTSTAMACTIISFDLVMSLIFSI